MVWSIGSLSRKVVSQPRDPSRLPNLKIAVATLQWNENQTVDDLQTLTDKLVDLIQAEIDYYDNARAKSRRTSRWFRSLAFVFGTLGLLCPLIQPLVPMQEGLSGLGFVFLAGAAASQAGNELFGGTRGHIRYVSTQYRLEALTTQFLLDWSAWKSTATTARARGTAPASSEPIALMKTFAAACHAAVAEETLAWGNAIMQAATNYGKDIR